jgi:hypothetical protein
MISQSTMMPPSERKVKLAKCDSGLVKNTQTITLSGYVLIAQLAIAATRSR